MSEFSNEQPTAQDPRSVSVDQFHDQLRLTRDRMSEVARMVRELETWSAEVPRRHRPHGQEVLVTDLVQTTVADPAELQRRVAEVADLVVRVRAEVEATQAAVRDQTGPFAPAGGAFRTLDGGDEVAVEVRLGTARFDDDEGFEQQRTAIRGVLTYTARDRTWRGRLPAVVGDAPHGWEAVIAAARAGAGAEVILRP